MSQGLAIGTTRQADGYEGVLRDGRTVVFRCGHRHPNRDQSTRANSSAYNCIRSLVQASALPGLAEAHRAGFREIEANLRRLYGRVSLPPGMPLAAERTVAFDAQLDELRTLVKGRAVAGMAGSVVLSAVA